MKKESSRGPGINLEKGFCKARKHLLPFILLFILVNVLILFFFSWEYAPLRSEKVKKSKLNLNYQPKLHSNHYIKPQTANNNPSKGEKKFFFDTWDRKPKEKYSEEEEEKRGTENRSDHPDLFAQFERGIRTREGDKSPGYPPNYKIKELLKSRKINSIRELKKNNKNQNLNWTERGPGNVAGRTRGIIIDPDDPNHNTWFAGSVDGGIWKTTNAGESWTNLTPDIGNLATSTLAMAMSNHNVIYAGTGEGFFNADQIDGTGIWKTTDKGSNWEQLASTANNRQMQNITRIIVDPSNENILLVSAAPGFYYTSSDISPHSGIFKSLDGGISWEMVFDAGLHSVEDLIFNPENFNTQYATVNSVGVIKSINGGKTWINLSNGINTSGSAAGVQRMEIAIAPTDTSTLYISSEDRLKRSMIFGTDNGGNDWFSLSDSSNLVKNLLGGQGWYDNTIAVDAYDRNKIYIGGVGLWQVDRISGTDTSAKHITKVDEVNTSSFLSFVNWGGRYAEGGLDIGEAFHGFHTHLNDSEYTSVEIRFGPGKHQKAHRFLFFYDFLYPYQDYVDVPFEVWDIEHNRQLTVSFLDQDNSKTWNPRNRASAPGGVSREYVFISAIKYNPAEPDSNIAVTAGMAYKNTYAFWGEAPAGTTFDPNNLPNSIIRINWGRTIMKHIVIKSIADVYNQYGGTSKDLHPDQHNISLIKTNEGIKSFRIVIANDGGVYYSDDKGATFNHSENGYNTAQFYGVDKMKGAERFIGGTQDNGSWISPLNPNSTSRWVHSKDGDGFEAVWKYDDPNEILESSQYNSISKSTDGGLTWADAINGLKDTKLLAPFFTKLAKSKQDPDLVFTIGNSGIWRSDNFASSWTLSEISANYFNGISTFAQVKVSLANPQIVWAGSGMSNNNKLFVSKDGGLTFHPTNNYSYSTLGNISNIETDPVNDSIAYALFSFAKSPKILKTADLGTTWKDISGFGTDTVSSSDFPDVAVYCLLVMPYDPNVIWAGTEIGIFQSTDSGLNWEYLNSGFPAVSVWEMEIVNDEIVVATHGRGIWTVKIPELAGYEPAVITKSPRLNTVAQNPSGILVIQITLRSSYDSTNVLINHKVGVRLSSNSFSKDTTVFYSALEPNKDLIQILSYKKGIAYKSYEIISDDKARVQAQNSYTNNFNSLSNDFKGNGFSTYTIPSGFNNGAIQSIHPYLSNANYSYQLMVPIIVSEGDASLSYDDIALVEPGPPGSVFGDKNFSDYVIVEGTKDGINWIPLLDGYNAQSDSIWFAAFSSNTKGDTTMFKNHIVNFTPTFGIGDTILIRFRLHANNAINGWGWAIDNLNIQEFPVSVELSSFTANSTENKITLLWETDSENNNTGFEIQRSLDKKNFKKVSYIPGNGSTNEKHVYSFIDNSTSGGEFYYRLKIIDINGHFVYSNILEVSALPDFFSLSQNYPNPFNPSTTIKFQLPQQEKVSLEIYNTLGEKIKTLIDEIKAPGFYRATWNGTNNNNINVASGVYIYRIAAGKFVLSKKMIFLK